MYTNHNMSLSENRLPNHNDTYMYIPNVQIKNSKVLYAWKNEKQIRWDLLYLIYFFYFKFDIVYNSYNVVLSICLCQTESYVQPGFVQLTWNDSWFPYLVIDLVNIHVSNILAKLNFNSLLHYVHCLLADL